MTVALLVVTLAMAWPANRVSAAPPAERAGPCEVRVELTDGTTVAGTLEAIDQESVRLAGDSPRDVPVKDVRRVMRVPARPTEAMAVRVACRDGARIDGDDVLWDGAPSAVVIRGDERIEVPIDRIVTVNWQPRPATGAAGTVDPAWLAALPAEPASDLVAVSRGDDFELVECAITAVSAETVTVILDGERIPVKRGKVLGLAWLRPAAPTAAATQVTIAGGRLAAGSVAWTPRALVLDGVVKVPGHLLESIDYAAGRTVPLVSLPMEQVKAEPFFGGLATVEGMAAFFAPRVVPPAGAAKGDPFSSGRSLLVRPRTVAVWRVPADSRHFRARVVRAATSETATAVQVSLRLDDQLAWERSLEAAAAVEAIDIAVVDARRLTLTVDFVSGDMGCPVRFDDAVFEK
jgi:hypothetical protein